MFTRLLLVMSILLMTIAVVRAEPVSTIYLVGNSTLDNTQRNVRDKDGTSLTPEEQKETKKDIKITANIRKTAVKDKLLSVDAHNIKIISRNGVVTLRGPVENQAENLNLQNIAMKTRGVVRVVNQLENKAP